MIPLLSGVPTADYSDLSEAAPTVEPTPDSVRHRVLMHATVCGEPAKCYFLNHNRYRS